jgi:SAM-dependent methyltransferase
MERQYLLLIELAESSLFSKNVLGLLKDSFYAGEERLLFILMRLEKGSVNRTQAAVQVHEYTEKYTTQLLKEIFLDCSLEKGKQLSKQERLSMGLDKSLTYGEIDFTSFYKVLRDIPEWANRQGVFYDLGSGTGRAVIASRVLADFRVCKGVEILKGLHDEAMAISTGSYQFKAAYRRHFSVSDEVELYCGSLTSIDWSDGDVIFANSTCFSDALMIEMAEMADKLKKSSLFITFTKALPNKHFEVTKKIRYKMSWGPATVYYHRKISDASEQTKQQVEISSHASTKSNWSSLAQKLCEKREDC